MQIGDTFYTLTGDKVVERICHGLILINGKVRPFCESWVTLEPVYGEFDDGYYRKGDSFCTYFKLWVGIKTYNTREEAEAGLIKLKNRLKK